MAEHMKQSCKSNQVAETITSATGKVYVVVSREIVDYGMIKTGDGPGDTKRLTFTVVHVRKDDRDRHHQGA